VVPAKPKIIHVSVPKDFDEGKDDILLQNLKLEKNWAFYHLEVTFDNIFEIESNTAPGLGIIAPGPENIHQYARLDQNFGSKIGNVEGRSILPNVSVKWSYTTGGIAYEVLLLAKGPKGTFP
jgi:hypothetical protein